MRPATRTLLLCVLVAHLSAAPGSARRTVQRPRGTDAVSRVLVDARSAAVPPSLLAELLAGGGVASLPPLFEALSSGRFTVRVGERGNSSKELTEHERGALVAAIGLLPWARVTSLLDERYEGGFEESERLAAIEVLGAHGTETDLPSLLLWTEPDDPRERVPRPRRAVFTRALGGILERRPQALGEMPRFFEAAHLSLVPPILSVLSARPSEPTLRALANMLGRVPAADALVLTEVAHAARAVRHPVDEGTRELVRAYLRASRGALLCEAILAAGELSDRDSVPRLIELLDSDDAGIRARAHDALVDISGQDLGSQRRAWSQWHAQVHDWWIRRAPEDLRRVRDASPTIASRSILELSRQRLYRHELAQPLAYGLERKEVDVVVLTCAALGHLGSPLSVPPLIVLLDDQSVEVRRAAFLALQRITGENHGDLPGDWLAAGW